MSHISVTIKSHSYMYKKIYLFMIYNDQSINIFTVTPLGKITYHFNWQLQYSVCFQIFQNEKYNRTLGILGILHESFTLLHILWEQALTASVQDHIVKHCKGYLYSEQPWEIETVSTSRAKGGCFVCYCAAS